MRRILALVALVALTGPAPAQEIDFGNDSGRWPNDGECDDRRFFGPGMASELSWQEAGRDASDCRAALAAGRIRVWNLQDSLAATQCSAIDFGADTADYANDGECDDPRFEGVATDGWMLSEDLGGDATDCRRACEFGLLGLRDYATDL